MRVYREKGVALIRTACKLSSYYRRILHGIVTTLANEEVDGLHNNVFSLQDIIPHGCKGQHTFRGMHATSVF